MEILKIHNLLLNFETSSGFWAYMVHLYGPKLNFWV